MSQMIMGATAAGSAVIGIFFYRFWRHTHDRFFLLFSLAFWIFALSRVAMGTMPYDDEDRYLLYVVRLAATVLIIFAIVDKNIRPPEGRGDEGS